MLLRYPWFSYLIVGIFLTSGCAQAANLHIDDTAADGQITITWTGFLSLSVNGGFSAPSGSVMFTPCPSCDPPTLSFFGSYSTPISNGAPGQTLYFVDPGTSHVRDKIFTFAESGGPGVVLLTGSFISDFPTDLGSLPALNPGDASVQVTGGSQELVPTFLNLPAGVTIQVVAKLVTQNPLGGTGTSANPSG